MWNIELYGMDLFFVVYSFFILSFAGWIYESTKCSLAKKMFVNRGFLNGPIIPVYGMGGTLVYLLLRPFSGHVAAVFLLGFILTTLLEYTTAVLMEQAFHAKWWDYSRFKYNYQGRVCLPASLLWAVFSVADVYVLGPYVQKLVERIPRRFGEWAGYVLVVITLVDFAVTVVYTLQLSNTMERLNELREELLTYLLSTSLIEKTGEVKEALYSTTIGKLSEKRDSAMNILTTRFKAGLSRDLNEEEKERKVTMFKHELEGKFKHFITKYKSNMRKHNFIHKRLLKAFPTLTFTKGRYYLLELKERINFYNDRK